MCCSHDSAVDCEGCDKIDCLFVVILLSPFVWFQKKNHMSNDVLFTDVLAVVSHWLVPKLLPSTAVLMTHES